MIFPILLAFLVASASGSPTLQARQSITTLSQAQIAALKPFASYASASYCSPSTTLAWSCGANCNANPTFKPVASGGNGNGTPFWYVGFDPTLNTVIVGHEGTNTSSFVSELENGDIILESFDSTLFPGVSSSVKVHDGFKDEHANAANAVLAAVNTAISRFGATHVTTVGHSLGAALALIDGVFLPLHLPSNVGVSVVGFGVPRVGNQAFANYVDSHLPNLVSRVNNKEDIVPILPGMFLGYHHPSGEIHIMDDGSWVACPGQDNPSDECSTGDVPTILQGDESDHDGPYDGVEMGC